MATGPSNREPVMNKRMILAAILASLASACAVVPVEPYYGGTVVVEPPPLRVEYPGYPPYPGYVWITGYWSWGGQRHVWVPGRWVAPRPGYVWVAPRWVRDGPHWRMHEGRWDQDERPRTAPPPPARITPPRVDEREAKRHDDRRDDRRGRDDRRHDGYRPDYRPDYRPQTRPEAPQRSPEMHHERRWLPSGATEAGRDERVREERDERGEQRGSGRRRGEATTDLYR